MAAHADSDAGLPVPRDSKLGDPTGDHAARARIPNRIDNCVGVRVDTRRFETD